jgi:hypothetical protein
MFQDSKEQDAYRLENRGEKNSIALLIFYFEQPNRITLVKRICLGCFIFFICFLATLSLLNRFYLIR